MVPRLLKVQNFLSYGVNAPELDFSLFKVACLSGANGQGKSALLEAMTWALWGEARKNTGDLLRTGAQRMSVDFTFEVEGKLYRVERTYSVSGTGKSTKSTLDVYAQDVQGAWQTLTEATMSLTDQRLSSLLGVKYDTFVNASFLMQGRSDEFTRKTPASRKEVLANILDLSRYELLEAAARDRAAELSQTVKTLEVQGAALDEQIAANSEIESRVDAALAEGRELKHSLEAFQVGLERAQRELAEAEQALLAVRGWKDSAQTLRKEREAIEEEYRALETRIQKATALVAQRDRLTQEADRYEVVRVERERLLNLNALHAGLRQQAEANERRLTQRRAQLDGERTRLQERVLALEQQVEQLVTRVTAGSGLVSKRDEARLAATPLESLRNAERRHTERERARQALETQLREARNAAQSRLDSLRGEDVRLQQSLQSANIEPEVLEKTRQEVARWNTVQQELERIREEGESARKAFEALIAMLEGLKREVERIDRQRAVVQHPESPRCPTCGTDLTPEHRKTVMQELREERDRIVADQTQRQAEARTAEARVQTLRATFARLREESKGLAEAPSRLATLEERVKQAVHVREQRERIRREGIALRERLEAVPFDPELQSRLEAITQEAERDPFDVAALRSAEAAEVQARALEAQVQAWHNDERSLANTRDALTRQKTMLEHHVKAVDVDPELTRCMELRRQLAQHIDALGFDAAALSAVTREAEQLRDAPARLRDVLHAQSALAEAASNRAQLDERRDRTRAALVEVEQHLATEPALRERESGARAEVERASGHVRSAQRAQAEHQKLVGGLLERREAYRTHLARQAALEGELKSAKEQESLYRHLRQAFGKNGIPALIIEHTVPEIEYRANELLDPLSQGKLHLRLETSRVKRDGNEAETLDVIVLDDTGSKRPYETFSGGEAFRINFALRLALSHILAERAGVRIRTLVIDEGFGTQDPEGIVQLIEAIRTVQDSFDKILVISHLDEIKEAFPVRIEVRKEPVLGSTFDVIGVG